MFVPYFVVHCPVFLSCNHRDWEERAGSFTFLSSWYLVIAMWPIFMVQWAGLQCAIVVFPDCTHFVFMFSWQGGLHMQCIITGKQPN